MASTQRLDFSGGRLLLFSLLGDPLSDSLNQPFAALLPAFDKSERQQAEGVVAALVDRGCMEFCCVGPEAEKLHDSIDDIIEEKGALEVVTTWLTDSSDACEHFLFATGGMPPTLLALVASHPELVAMLEKGAPR